MPKLVNYGKGGRFNLWVPERLLPTFLEIDNRSKFLQIALEQAVGIMTFAILKEKDPKNYYEVGKLEDVIDDYNTKFPVDPLTKKRQDNERAQRADQADSPQSHNELW